MLTGTLILVAYLVGAIPFGLLLGRLHGVDIRAHGSRNIGATNVGRVLGRKWGFLCLILDVLKGLLPVLLAGRLLVSSAETSPQLLAWLAVAFAAVLGHVFPVYLGFRGGKGVATTVGVALGIYPWFTLAMGAALIAYAAVRFATGLVSLGSLTIAVVFPVALLLTLYAFEGDLRPFWPLLAAAILLSTLIVVRHVGNIRRLLRGEEVRVSRSASLPSEGSRG
jgi:glycerol-3-phosphate acyltransferase PlsY